MGHGVVARFLSELKRRNVLRVAALYVAAGWVLLQGADLVFDLLGLSTTSLRLVLGLLVLGFPVAVAFSWIYELTPDGLRRDRGVSTDLAHTAETARRLDLTVVVVAAVAILVVVADRLLPHGGAAAGPAPVAGAATPGKSVAVLPFANMSAESANDFFSDGLAEEILNALAQVPGLRVPSRTSSFSFRGKDLDLKKVAADLRVENVLEGSVRREGERIRVTAQLIDATSDTHLWSRTWDRTLRDVFEIQREIASEIAGTLRVQFSGADQGPRDVGTRNVQAYDRYLEGRHLFRQRGRARLLEAERLFEGAIRLDPGFARAHAALATVVAVMPSYTGPEVPIGPLVAKAEAAARRALELDPALSEPHAALATVREEQWDYVGAEAEYRKALELDPNDTTSLQWYSELLSRVGRFTEGDVYLQRALAVDPLSPILTVVSGQAALYTRGDVEGALALAQRVRALGLVERGAELEVEAHVAAGRFAEARAVQPRNETRTRILDALADPSRRRAALDAIAGLPAGSRRSDGSLQAQLLPYLLLGEAELAYGAAARSVQDRTIFPSDFLGSGRGPGFHRFRSDPRFQALVRDTGLLAYWKASGFADGCRPKGVGVVCEP